MLGPERFPFAAMGSRCELQLYGETLRIITRAADMAINEVVRIERVFSRYRTDNIVYAINSAAERAGGVVVDGEVAQLLDIAYEAYRRSDGLFDVTSGVLREIWNSETIALPSKLDVERIRVRLGLEKVLWQKPNLTFTWPGMQIDLGGIGKEYAADRAADVCRQQGVEYGLVDLGGDISVIGAHPDQMPWRIGVSDPRNPDRAVATLFAMTGGIATSGSYERCWVINGQRYSHIVNPITGWPVMTDNSVTVHEKTCLAAGICSTIAVLKGDAGSQWLRDQCVQNICVDALGRYELSGFENLAERGYGL